MHSFKPIVLGALLVVALQSVGLGQTEWHIDYVGPDDAAGMSLAVVVGETALAHTAQLLPVDPDGQIAHGADVRQQIDRVLASLETVLAEVETGFEHLVKINVYVARTEVVSEVKRRFASRFRGREKPAVTFVVTRLPHPDALVAMDAVVAVPTWQHSEAVPRRRSTSLAGNSGMGHVSVLPRGSAVYVAGQSARGDLAQATRKTMESLHGTLEYLGLKASHVVELKAFLRPMSDAAIAEKEIARLYRAQDQLVPPITYVEWVSRNPIEIELVAFAPRAAPSSRAHHTVSFITPPGMTASPVFSRVARVHGGRTVYVSGLYARSRTDAEGQIREIFGLLGQLLEKAGTDFDHLAKATYYVSADDVSRKLNEIRPEFYDPRRPPAASKAMVKGVGMPGRSITLDMIAVTPN